MLMRISGLCADDAQLAEFLQVMQPRNKGAIWANNDPSLALQKQGGPGSSPGPNTQAVKGQKGKAARTVGNQQDEGFAGTRLASVSKAGQEQQRQQRQLKAPHSMQHDAEPGEHLQLA